MTALDEAVEELAAAARTEGWAAAVARLGGAVDRLDVPPRPVPPLAAALWYAEQGLPVFPVQAGTKVPYPRTRGFKDATTDPDALRAWWAKWPDANVGLATGHRVDVIDFDGLTGHVSWGLEFPDEKRPWGDARLLGTVSTPRPGGLHAYVAPTGRGNGAANMPGIDYRGRGGYVLAPPSVLDDRPGQHPGTYRFLRPLNLEGLL